WAVPTKECLERAQSNLENDLCDLLLNFMFTLNRASDPLLESYLTYATTGSDKISSATSPLISNELLLQPQTFVARLTPFGLPTISRNAHQWTLILKLLPTILTTIDADKLIQQLQQSNDDTWMTLLQEIIILLCHIIAVSLHPEHYAVTEHPPQTKPTTFAPSASFHTLQGFDSQLSFNTTSSSQPMGFDPEATIELDNFEGGDTQIQEQDDASVKDGKTNTTNTAKSVETVNAILAAQLIIDLVEKKGARRMFEVRNNRIRMDSMKEDGDEGEKDGIEMEGPWATCQQILKKSPTSTSTLAAASDPQIQKAVLLIERLTDRELERRMAVHMKYHELEDEGTARAMPSAGLMGLLYHMVQIRPCLDDQFIVDYLLKLQTIKGSFDESFYLELWFTALTGLREASLSTSCQRRPTEKQSENSTTSETCPTSVATNRLLWKSLVLVKLNTLESSLSELKAFTGLLNACSPPACCSEFYAPSSLSSSLVDKIAQGGEDDDDDDIMKMINDMSYSVDLNTPAVTKAIRAASNQDIFTSIVNVCEQYGFVRKYIGEKLLAKDAATDDDKEKGKDKDIKLDQDDFSGFLDTDNIDQRIEAIRSNVSHTSLLELIHIGLVSIPHLRKVVEFFVEYIHEKASAREVYSLAHLCQALSECPSMIDLMVQIHHPSAFLRPLEKFCNEWKPSDSEMETDGGPSDEELDGIQLLYSKFGDIWTFVVLVIHKFNLYRSIGNIFQSQHQFCCQFFTQHPSIYGIDVRDHAMESLLQNWQIALGGGDGVSDDLLRSTSPQQWLMMAPTVMERALLVYNSGQMEEDVFLGILSYYQTRFLSFAVAPNTIITICEHLLNQSKSSAIHALRILLTNDKLPLIVLQICGNTVLGTIAALTEKRRQQHWFSNQHRDTTMENGDIENDLLQLRTLVQSKLGMEEPTETEAGMITATEITSHTLFEKTQEMFRYIVRSGRSMFMNDVDAVAAAVSDQSKQPKQMVSHYLDMVMFQTSLDMGGVHGFVTMIVDEVLEAGKSGGAVRAAELGSCLIATPLMHTVNDHSNCFNLLHCLLLDVIPASIRHSAASNASFFQGQTLGVFASDCLVLMQGRSHDTVQMSVEELGQDFFNALTVDEAISRQPRRSASRIEKDGGRFADWDLVVIESAVWRGFIKGLMSNPLIKEMWPSAFLVH
ncbi:mediator complex subunit Med5-domain-containing protein, partial [Radiomyces spectabilis]|uniref:mediator complex subunit Med5-domain-containing protein n=1 Tax=Radiomyces spectabilis TaxID=64574 RepID=UPI00221F12AA